MKKIVMAHKFFVRESSSFMEGTSRWTYYLRYPLAYITFMYMVLTDFSTWE